MAGTLLARARNFGLPRNLLLNLEELPKRRPQSGTVGGAAKAEIFEAAVRGQKRLVLAFKKHNGCCLT
jgi:hypothetical protein